VRGWGHGGEEKKKLGIGTVIGEEAKNPLIQTCGWVEERKGLKKRAVRVVKGRVKDANAGGRTAGV